MTSVRGLPEGLWETIESQLGPQEALRLMWPAIIGARLAATTRLEGLRAGTLIIAVPDRVWRASVHSLRHMVVDAVNRFCGRTIANWAEINERPEQFQSAVETPKPQMRSSGDGAHVRAGDVEALGGPIRDPVLRAVFLRSAAKYLAMQEERRR